MAQINRIDVHHHFAPPAYIQELTSHAQLYGPLADWTPERSIETMDEGGVDVSITSITIPGLWFGDDEKACLLARISNDYAARLRADHPDRFGMFVNLPLPDIDGSLAEIEYGMDELGADGVAVFTSYGDIWFGDPQFEPVYQELNRRKAIVYTHPKTPNCCVNLVPEIPDAVIEYQTDTSRAIARMVFTGMAAKYPDMRIIWSHGGGTMPFLVDRFNKLARVPEVAARMSGDFLDAAGKFFYDTAQVSGEAPMRALRAVATAENIAFGTDFPFMTPLQHTDGLATGGVFNEAELRGIDRDNILRWMPQYTK